MKVLRAIAATTASVLLLATAAVAQQAQGSPKYLNDAAVYFSARRKAFDTCFKQAYQHWIDDNLKDTGDPDCGTCEAERDQAVHSCKQYLTADELRCEDSAEYGYQMGDPFRCEEGR